jgi:hypothetical protein
VSLAEKSAERNRSNDLLLRARRRVSDVWDPEATDAESPVLRFLPLDPFPRVDVDFVGFRLHAFLAAAHF